MFCILDFSAGNSIKYAQAKALERESEREKKVFKWAVTYLWGVKWVFLLKATPMFFFILEKGRDTERNRHEVSGNGCPFWTGHLLDRFEWANGKVRRFFSLFSALENWFTFLASVLPLFFFFFLSVQYHKGLFTWLDFCFWKQQVPHGVKDVAAETKGWNTSWEFVCLLANFVFFKF